MDQATGLGTLKGIYRAYFFCHLFFIYCWPWRFAAILNSFTCLIVDYLGYFTSKAKNLREILYLDCEFVITDYQSPSVTIVSSRSLFEANSSRHQMTGCYQNFLSTRNTVLAKTQIINI